MAQTQDASPAVMDYASRPSTAARIDRRYVTAALMLVMVLASMEMTVTSTAMPTIIGELHGLEHYSWVASIYLLASTVTMPLYGRLADTLGRKRVVLFSIALFVVASMLAASARSTVQLIVYRGLQGLGDVRSEVLHMISRGLTWVFVAMLAVALVQLVVTTLMPSRRRADHVPKAGESLEAIGH